MERNLTKLKGKLVKIIRDDKGRCDDYFVSPKFRQLLLHWGY